MSAMFVKIRTSVQWNHLTSTKTKYAFQYKSLQQPNSYYTSNEKLKEEEIERKYIRPICAPDRHITIEWQETSIENIAAKGVGITITQPVLFSHNVFFPFRAKFPPFISCFVICKCFQKKSWKNCSLWSAQRHLNPFPNKPWFIPVCNTSRLKTLWEKEKLLVKSNFSFSPSVFYPFWELSAIFIKFEIVVCKLSQFGRVQNLSFGKGLNVFGNSEN